MGKGPKRILVIVSAPKMAHIARQGCFASCLDQFHLPVPGCDIELEEKYRQALIGYSGKAKKIFGGYFRKVYASIRAARALGFEIDLFILSPRYGMIDEEEMIIPYVFPLSHSSKSEVRALSSKLKTKEKALSILKRGYDLVFIACNKSDLLMINDPRMGFRIEDFCKRLCVIAAPSSSADFGKGVLFHGCRHPSDRSSLLIKEIEDLTIRRIDEY